MCFLQSVVRYDFWNPNTDARFQQEEKVGYQKMSMVSSQISVRLGLGFQSSLVAHGAQIFFSWQRSATPSSSSKRLAVC